MGIGWTKIHPFRLDVEHLMLLDKNIILLYNIVVLTRTERRNNYE